MKAKKVTLGIPHHINLDPAEFEDQEEWEDAKYETLGHLKTCAVSTQIGHQLWWLADKGLPTGTNQICMTPTQLRKLFGSLNKVKDAERLGCGAFACAWGTGEDEVVKITTDGDDVDALQRAQGLEHVVKLRDTYELIGAGIDADGDSIDAYALKLERLEPVDEAMAEVIEEFPTGRIREDFRTHYGEDFATADEADPDYKLDDATLMAFTYACDRYDYGDEDGPDDDYNSEHNACLRFVDEVARTVEQLGKLGINWSDIHSGNIGMKNGTWKALDIGATGAQFHPDAKLLKGADPKMQGSFCEYTARPRSQFDSRSFRWKPSGKNWILVGCPKGKWDEKTSRCRVGTRAHKVLKASTDSRCRRGRKIRKG